MIAGGKVLRHIRSLHKDVLNRPQPDNLVVVGCNEAAYSTPGLGESAIDSKEPTIPSLEEDVLPIDLSTELMWFDFQTLEDLLTWFEKELKRPSRQQMTHALAMTHVRQVRALLDAGKSLSKADDIYVALDSLKCRDGTNMKPGSKYSVLLSFKRLLTYLKQERGAVIYKEKLSRVIERIQEWQPRLSADKKRRRAELWKQDSLNISQLDLSIPFDETTSNMYLEALTDEGMPISKQLEARSFVLLRLMAENASRVGAILSVSISDVERIKLTDEMESITLTIPRHKTNDFGCAFLVCSRVLFTLMDKLAALSRRWLSPDTEEEHLFVTQHGTPMSGSNIVSCVNSVYKKLGGKGRITPTITRKRCARLTVMERSVELQRNHARAMNHSLATHERYYASMPEDETRELSVEMHRFLNERQGRRVCTQSTSTATAPETEPIIETPVKRRRTYTEAENQTLRTVFCDVFRAEDPEKMTLALVYEKMDSSTELQDLMKDRRSLPREIYDKVRHMRKREGDSD